MYEYRDSEFAPEVAWKKLRTLRSSPPGAAAASRRRATFGAALEQAEQLFNAASQVTSATKPLLVFYAVSQAGRAVAAASTECAEWTLRGHGLRNGSLSGMTPDRLAGLTVRQDRSGAFVDLANILNAAPLSQPVRLGDLWCLIPGVERFALPGMGSSIPLRVSAPGPMYVRHPSVVQAYVEPVPATFSQISRGSGGGWEEVGQEVGGYLEPYPSLSDWRFFTLEGQPFDLQYVAPGFVRVTLEWSADGSASEEVEIARRTVRYGYERLAFPRVGADDCPAHPFLIWWALLFVLSKLARYEPESWATLTSVDQSAAAVPIDHLLAHGLTVLPEIIYRTILEVSEGR